MQSFIYVFLSIYLSIHSVISQRWLFRNPSAPMLQTIVQPLTLIRDKLQRQPWQPKNKNSVSVGSLLVFLVFFPMQRVTALLSVTLLTTLCGETGVKTGGFSSVNHDVATPSNSPRQIRGPTGGECL